MALTEDQKKLRKIKKIIKDFRDSEENERYIATSRSTGIRNVYRSGYCKLAEIEKILNP